MFIIWGSRNLTSDRGSGRFYCPQCERVDLGYSHRSAREWFTLYFIPIFPIGSHTEFVECHRCRATFTPAVLEIVPPTEDDLFLRDCYERMTRGRSLELVEADLIESGRTTEVAVEMIDAMTKGKVWECVRCNAHYLKGVRRCRECDGRRELSDGNVQL